MFKTDVVALNPECSQTIFFLSCFNSYIFTPLSFIDDKTVEPGRPGFKTFRMFVNTYLYVIIICLLYFSSSSFIDDKTVEPGRPGFKTLRMFRSRVTTLFKKSVQKETVKDILGTYQYLTGSGEERYRE